MNSSPSNVTNFLEIMARQSDRYVFNYNFVKSKNVKVTNYNPKPLDMQCYTVRIVDTVKDFFVVRFYYGHDIADKSTF
jgi:hypothetical protein